MATMQGIGTFGWWGGSGGSLPVPDAPTGVSGVALSSTSLRLSCDFIPTATGIDWYECSNAAGDDPVILAGMPVADFEHVVTGLSAMSTHYYKSKARNGSGQSVAFSAVAAVTTKAAKEILTYCLEKMASDIEDMSTANGYNYNWGSSNRNDQAKKDTYPNSEIYLSSETNQDSNQGTSANSYTNSTVVEIHSFTELDAVADMAVFDAQTYIDKMISDLKKCFATDYNLGENCYSVRYLDYRVETIENGDAIVPVKVISRWQIQYAQDALNPSIPAQ
jgi:hypothetical protein